MAGPRGKSFGTEQNERIRVAAQELLSRHGGSQRALAEHLGVAQPTVSNFLNGKTGAGPQLAVAIANARGVSLDELRGGTSSRSGGPRWRDLPWWPEVIAIARKMAPRVSALSWERLGNLMGEMPPSRDPATIAMLALGWDQAASDNDRAAADAALSDREMAEEDAEVDDLLRRRAEARRDGRPLPRLPDDVEELPPPPPPVPSKKRPSA